MQAVCWQGSRLLFWPDFIKFSSFRAIRSISRPCISSSCLIGLASPDSAMGCFGRACPVSRRKVWFSHFCRNLLRFYPHPLDGKHQMPAHFCRYMAVSEKEVNRKRSAGDVFRFWHRKVWLCSRANLEVSTQSQNLKDEIYLLRDYFALRSLRLTSVFLVRAPVRCLLPRRTCRRDRRSAATCVHCCTTAINCATYST